MTQQLQQCMFQCITGQLPPQLQVVFQTQDHQDHQDLTVHQVHLVAVMAIQTRGHHTGETWEIRATQEVGMAEEGDLQVAGAIQVVGVAMGEDLSAVAVDLDLHLHLGITVLGYHLQLGHQALVSVFKNGCGSWKVGAESPAWIGPNVVLLPACL